MKPNRQNILLPKTTTLLFAQFYAPQKLIDVKGITI